jgi:hypothetical protein
MTRCKGDRWTLEVEGESKPRTAYEKDVISFSSDQQNLRPATPSDLKDAKENAPTFACRPPSPIARDPDDVRRLKYTPRGFYFVEGTTRHPCIVMRHRDGRHMVLFLDTNQCEFNLDAVRRNMHVNLLRYIPSLADRKKRKRVDERYLDTDEDERPNADQENPECHYSMMERKNGDVDILESQGRVTVMFTDKQIDWPSYWQGANRRRVCNVPWSMASRLHECRCYEGLVRESGKRFTPIWMRHHSDGNLYIYTDIVDVRAQQAARLAAHSAMKCAIDVRKGIVDACDKIDTIVSECKSKLSTLVQSVTLT